MRLPPSHQDLADADCAVFTTIDVHGRPQSTVVWFLITGDEIRLSLNTARAKFRNLMANPECTLVIVDPENAYRYVEIRASVSVRPDPGYEFASVIARKYDTDYRAVDGPEATRVVVTLHPRKINATTVVRATGRVDESTVYPKE